MTDGFARASAQHAHALIRELTGQIQRLEKAAARRSLFHGRCYLCGDPVKKGSRYCAGHDWAAGR